MEILREILNFVGGVVRMKSFFFRLSGISLDRQRGGGKQATQQEQLGYRVCGVTGPGSYTSQSSLSIPLSFSFTLSPSRFPPDPASSYFARFPQMLIALFPNANSFLTSERRVYPAFFSLSLFLFLLFFSLSSPHSFSHSRFDSRPREVSILHLHGPRERDCAGGIKFANRVGN